MASQPLPPGWTEHKAPSGVPYWYNSQTKKSTYKRPTLAPPPPPAFVPGAPPGFVPPAVAAAASTSAPTTTAPSTAAAAAGEGAKKEKKEKPKHKEPIAGTSWLKVTTNKGNTFWTNTESKESVWTIPDEVKQAQEEQEKFVESRKRSTKSDDENADENGDGEEATADEEEKAGAAEATGEEDEEPKRKKRKRAKVVHEIEELEQDADYRAQLEEEERLRTEAEEKARVAQLDGPTPAVRGESSEPAEEAKSEREEEQPRKGRQQLDVTPEEAVALYKAMLSEKDIDPMAPWDNELPKFVHDPRYTAVRSARERRDLFDEFCKVTLRERRAAKKSQGETKVDPAAGFRELLRSVVTSTRTLYSEFKREHGSDQRYRAFGKTEGERERAFKGWLRELGEQKRAKAERDEAAFLDLLRESGVGQTDRWSEIKDKLRGDARYKAIQSSSLKEDLFKRFVRGEVKNGKDASAPQAEQQPKRGEDKQARAQASLREREEQVRRERERNERERTFATRALGREEGEREFSTLLIDAVRDHNATWDDTVRTLERDPRFEAGSLTPAAKHNLFRAHVDGLYNKRVAQVEGLFAQHASSLETPFEPVHVAIASDPHVARVTDGDVSRLEALYRAWQGKRRVTARQDFDELLRESPMIEYWVRLQKKEEGAGKEFMDEDEHGGDDVDIKEVAKQVDLPALHSTLKHDRRYTLFDHMPDERESWVKDYVEHVTAPKYTVHQR